MNAIVCSSSLALNVTHYHINCLTVFLVNHYQYTVGGHEEDHQLHHCCWTGCVGEREEEEEEYTVVNQCCIR